MEETIRSYLALPFQAQTPVRQITRQPIIEESPEKSTDDTEAVQEKISSLEDEVNKQQNIISQTSQALNLCTATPEFSGSTEQVEAEKVLLVASKIYPINICAVFIVSNSKFHFRISSSSEASGPSGAPEIKGGRHAAT